VSWGAGPRCGALLAQASGRRPRCGALLAAGPGLRRAALLTAATVLAGAAAGKGGGQQQTCSGRIFRMTGCEILYGPLNCDFEWGGNPWALGNPLAELAACGINYPSPDSITPARMASFVWSWAEGQPAGAGVGPRREPGRAAGGTERRVLAVPRGAEGRSGGGGGKGPGELGGPVPWAAMDAVDGRWYATAALGGGGEVGLLPAACRRVGVAACGWGEGGASGGGGPLWALGWSGAVVAGGSGQGCPSGYEFDLPRCPVENLELQQLLIREGRAGARLALQPPDYVPAWLAS
jgi:hypothetical protein